MIDAWKDPPFFGFSVSISHFDFPRPPNLSMSPLFCYVLAGLQVVLHLVDFLALSFLIPLPAFKEQRTQE